MATATTSKPDSKTDDKPDSKPASKPKPSKSKASATKPAGDPPARKEALKVREALTQKRESYDEPIVNSVSPLSMRDTTSEVETVGDKKPNVEVTTTGSGVILSVGSATIELDREGVFAAQNALNRAAAGL